MSQSRDLIATGDVSLTASLILAGVLQWLMLRRLIADARWWVLASVVAVATLDVLVLGLGLINRDVDWVLGLAVGWIMLGARPAPGGDALVEHRLAR